MPATSTANSRSPSLSPAAPVETGLTARPVPRELADELSCVAGWLEQRAAQVTLVHCDTGLNSPLPALPSFTPRSGATALSAA